MAPEIVKKLEYDAKSTDIWAIGVLAYRMLYGVPPFRASSEKELYTKIVKGKYSFPVAPAMPENQTLTTNKVEPRPISEAAKDMIRIML